MSGGQDIRLHDGRAAGRSRPLALAPRSLRGGPRRIGGGRPALRYGDLDEREGELPGADPTLPVREEADATGAIPLQRRAVEVPDRLSVHEVGGLDHPDRKNTRLNSSHHIISYPLF